MGKNEQQPSVRAAGLEAKRSEQESRTPFHPCFVPIPATRISVAAKKRNNNRLVKDG